MVLIRSRGRTHPHARRLAARLAIVAGLLLGIGGTTLRPEFTPRAEALLDLGGLILFESDAVTPGNPEGDDEIYVVQPNSTGLKQLTRNAEDDGDPSWSPDGKHIVFSSTRDRVVAPGDDYLTGELYVMRADGSNQTRLTNDEADDYSPDWSPDGRRIAFNSNRHDVNQPYLNIYLMDADGSDITRLTTSPQHIDDWWPIWSPDGTQIVFERRDFVANDTTDLYVMRADGSGERNLTNSPGDDLRPSWSPRGDLIAFFSGRDRPSSGDIYVIAPDGSNLTRLTNTPDGASHPQWSPDGRRIAFSRYIAATDEGDIYVMRANGSGVRQVTDEPGYEETMDWGKKRGLLGGILDLVGKESKKGKDEHRDGGHGKHHRDKKHAGSKHHRRH